MRVIDTTLLLATALLGACSSDSTITGSTSSGGTRASGRISLSASIDASRTQTLSGTTFTKRESAQGDLAFDLGEVEGQVGGQLFKWDGFYGGTASWFEEFTQPGSVQIPGTLNYRDCARVDSTSQSFSSASAGPQTGTVELAIYQGGDYQISIEAAGSGPTVVTQVSNTNCTGDGHNVRTTFPPEQNGLTLFSPYFNSYTMGASGSRDYVTGTIPKGSNRVNGVLQWVDSTSVEVFSSGSTRINVPVNVRLTWDITIK